MAKATPCGSAISSPEGLTGGVLMTRGELLYMYGVLVGEALMDIPAGGLIHTGNVVHAAESYAAREQAYTWVPPDVSKWTKREFLGFHREDGGVGTANYWLVIPLVFCKRGHSQHRPDSQRRGRPAGAGIS